MTSRIDQIKSLLRKAELKKIVKAARIEDEENENPYQKDDDEESAPRVYDEGVESLSPGEREKIDTKGFGEDAEHHQGWKEGEEVSRREWLDKATPAHNLRAKQIRMRKAIQKYKRLMKKRNSENREVVDQQLAELAEQFPGTDFEQLSKSPAQLYRERMETHRGKERADREQFRGEEVEYTPSMALSKYKTLARELKNGHFPEGTPTSPDVEMEKLMERFPDMLDLFQAADEEIEQEELEESDVVEEGLEQPKEEEELEEITIEDKKERQLFSEYNKLKRKTDEKSIAKVQEILAASPKIRRHSELVKLLSQYGKQLTKLESDYSKTENELDAAEAKGRDTTELDTTMKSIDANVQKLKEVRKPLQEELMQIIQSLEGRRTSTYTSKTDEDTEKYSIDDVLSMANDAYTFDDVKRELGDITEEKLKDMIREKMKQIEKAKEEAKKAKEEAKKAKKSSSDDKLEEVESYFFGRTVTAEEDEDESEDEDEDDSGEEKSKRGRKARTYEQVKDLPFHEISEKLMSKLTTEQKLSMSDLVELYAWNKYLDKLLSQKESDSLTKEEKKAKETAIQLERLEQDYGSTPKPEHGGIKRINPETGEVTYISLENWKKMVDERKRNKAKNRQPAMQSAGKMKLSIREADFDGAIPKSMEMVTTPLGEYYISELKDVASLWHSGQWSALYAFSSSGTVTSGLEREAKQAMENCEDPIEWDQLRAISMLPSKYLTPALAKSKSKINIAAVATCNTCGKKLSDKDIELDESECSHCRMLGE